jgi:hypothetical protein
MNTLSIELKFEIISNFEFKIFMILSGRKEKFEYSFLLGLRDKPIGS